jgi:hypothetical protein
MDLSRATNGVGAARPIPECDRLSAAAPARPRPAALGRSEASRGRISAVCSIDCRGSAARRRRSAASVEKADATTVRSSASFAAAARSTARAAVRVVRQGCLGSAREGSSLMRLGRAGGAGPVCRELSIAWWTPTSTARAHIGAGHGDPTSQGWPTISASLPEGPGSLVEPELRTLPASFKGARAPDHRASAGLGQHRRSICADCSPRIASAATQLLWRRKWPRRASGERR